MIREESGYCDVQVTVYSKTSTLSGAENIAKLSLSQGEFLANFWRQFFAHPVNIISGLADT
jgi:hypothetical protein